MTRRSWTLPAKLVWLMSALLLEVACSGERTTGPSIPSGDPATFRWSLPDGFPLPLVPADNPMSDAKVELGRRLFYDTRLSGNNVFSCSSCHRQANAFADARNLPFGPVSDSKDMSSLIRGRSPSLGNAEMWTNISALPCAGEMKPKPRSSFHFVRVPCARIRKV